MKTRMQDADGYPLFYRGNVHDFRIYIQIVRAQAQLISMGVCKCAHCARYREKERVGDVLGNYTDIL